MRKERRQHLMGLGVLILMAVVVLIALLGFRVHKVTVSGNSHHSSEEIAEDLTANFLSGNTLYLMWTYKNGEIPSSMPYLDSIKIKMKSPVSISVQVKEKPLAGYLEDGDYIYFDMDGIVLEITDKKYSDLTLVSGVSLGEVALYQKVPTKSSSQLRTVLNLMDLLSYYGLEAKEINFGVNSEITATIGHIECVFGQDEYMEEKVANMNAVLKNISKNTAGILHLENVTGKYEDITFTQTGTVTEESETEKNAETNSASSDGLTLGGTTTDGSAAAEDLAGGGEPDTVDEAEASVVEDADQADIEAEASVAEDADQADIEAEASVAEDADQADIEQEAFVAEDAVQADIEQEANEEEEDSSAVGIMVFNSSGQLVYNVRVQDGRVVDVYGNEVPGCSLNEDGYVVDAYMNIIDPATGELMN